MTFLCREDGLGDARQMSVALPELADAVEPGEIMYLADGAVRLRVTAVRAGEREFDAEVEFGGAVASRQGLNIPGETEIAPVGPRRRTCEHARTPGERIGVDLVALSFVRRAEDIDARARATPACRSSRRSRSRRRSTRAE